MKDDEDDEIYKNKMLLFKWRLVRDHQQLRERKSYIVAEQKLCDDDDHKTNNNNEIIFKFFYQMAGCIIIIRQEM